MISTLNVRPLTEYARQWGAVECTARIACDRLFPGVSRVGRTRVLTPEQAEELRLFLAGRGLIRK